MRIKRFRILDFELYEDRRQILYEKIRRDVILGIISLIMGLFLWNVMVYFITRDYSRTDDFEFALNLISNIVIILGIVIRTISKIKIEVDFERQIASWESAEKPEM